MGKIFGIALVLVMVDSMLGGLLATPPFVDFENESQALAQELGMLMITYRITPISFSPRFRTRWISSTMGMQLSLAEATVV